MDRIKLFIDELSKEESTYELTNVYSPKIPQGKICRENLYNYFQRIKNNNSKVMLIGEAPGYNGCRLSGIAFTCEENFTEDIIPRIMGIIPTEQYRCCGIFALFILIKRGISCQIELLQIRRYSEE